MTVISEQKAVTASTGENQWTRRIFLCLLITALLATVDLAKAQQVRKLPKIGVLFETDSPRAESFRRGLRELGYVDGENLIIEYRYIAGRQDRIAELAGELIRLKVNVIVTAGTAQTVAVKKSTSTVPIVVASAGDLVGTGLVASLAQPGGNVTGLTLQSPDLSGKRLELLKEIVLKLSRVALLLNPDNPLHAIIEQETEVAAKALSVRLKSLPVRFPHVIDRAFAVMTSEHSEALLVPLDPMFNAQQTSIVGLAMQHRLPTLYGERLYPDGGGLVSYGPNYMDQYRRAATYVDKILKGAKPADLPIEQPKKFELIINLKAAKQIGLTIPPNVLARADKVIK